MTSRVTKTEDQEPINQPSIHQPASIDIKIKRIWNFVYECIIKEFGSCLRHAWYRLFFNLYNHKLNPTEIQKVNRVVNQTAKVILLMHGAGAHESSFIPMAEQLTKAKIKNIFTVSLKQSNEDPIPIATLDSRIKELNQKYLSKGYSNVDFALVGHSLGALAAAKYIWKKEAHQIKNSQISMMISIAGRLKYVPNNFSWFCEDVRSEIDNTHTAIQETPNKATLYSIRGDGDAIVPEQSTHIQDEPKQQHTVKGWGHGGVVFAPETHRKVVSWVQEWQKTKSNLSVA